MGIPGLSFQLRGVGTHASVLQKKTEPGDRNAAIIDGPALAHSLLRSGKFVLDSVDLVPRYDYEAIGKAAVSWLNWLRSYGFEM